MDGELRASQLIRRGRPSPRKVLLDGEEQRQRDVFTRA